MIKPLSQRDPRWKDIPLGFSSYTIGSQGCTLTCISMTAGTTPDIANTQLKKVNGFVGGKILWANIGKAYPHLKFVWRSYAYDNTAVLNAIKRNGFCLVEATTLFNGKHWLLFIGNRQMIDPWYGTIRSTSAYLRYTGFAVLDRV